MGKEQHFVNDDLNVALMNLHMAIRCATDDAPIIPWLKGAQQNLGRYAKCTDADIETACRNFFKKG